MAKRKKSRKKESQKKRPGCLRRLIRSLLFLGILGGTLIVLFYGAWATFFDLDQLGVMPQRSAVYDVDGKLYSRLHGENRVVIPLSKVSEHFLNALLAREDSRFYRHPGIDPRGIARAMLRNVQHGSFKEGASTITQQLARNSYILGGKTLHRKMLEAMLTLRIEANYSKDEILEFYVNRIYFGSGMYGIETASQAYFDKPSASLSLSEGALLAGLIRSPNRFSPFNNLEKSIRERNTVLDRMAKLNMISTEQASGVKRWKVNVNKKRGRTSQHNYAMDAVMRDLDIILQENHIDEGGLRIYTTLDPRLMEAAETSIEKHLSSIEALQGYRHAKRSEFTAAQQTREEAPRYLQGALVAIDNRTGGIRALVGGRDYRQSKYNRAIAPMQRQAGSTFKPFMYTAAFNRGLLPGTVLSDGPLRAGEISSLTTPWNPSNSDGKFGGMLPTADGLIRSRNTMSVRVGEFAGLEQVRTFGNVSGFSQNIPALPAIYLGAFEANLKDITSAYTLFPNHGVRRQAYLIERIDDVNGQPIYRSARVQLQACDPAVTWLTSQLLQDTVDSGTGSRARALGFKSPAGGKTGTTNNYEDAWFVGYTTALTCGVWVGLDHPKRIISRGYGSTLALPIWAAVMQQAPSNRYPADKFKPPVKEEKTRVCSISSQLASQGCASAGTDYRTKLPHTLIPTAPCNVHGGGGRIPTHPTPTPANVLEKIKDLFRRK